MLSIVFIDNFAHVSPCLNVTHYIDIFSFECIKNKVFKYSKTMPKNIEKNLIAKGKYMC